MSVLMEGHLEYRRGLALLIAGFVYLFSVGWLLHIRFPVDDAFISFRYARNIAAGAGAVYNGAERVEGYTSFLWVMLLAGLAKVGLDIVKWSVGIGLAFAGLSVWLVWRFARNVFADWPAGPAGLNAGPAGLPIGKNTQVRETSSPALWAGLACVLLGTNGCFLCWSYVGMETPLYTFLLTLSIFLFTREISQDRPPLWSPLALAIAGLARPEAAALLPLNLVVLTVLGARAGRRWFPRAARYVVLFATIAGPHVLWRYLYYGFLLPNTYYAKIGGWEVALGMRGMAYVLSFYGAHTIWIVGLLGAVTAWRRLPVWFWYVSSVVLLYSAVIVYESGDCFPLFRLFVPVLPALSLLTVYGVAAWWERIRALALMRNRTDGMAVLAAAVVLWAAPSYVLVRMKWGLPRFQLEQYYAENWVRTGLWLRSVARAGESVAVTAAGAIPYYSKLYTVDMLGLNDEHIAHLPGRYGSSMPGHEKWDTDYILSRRPTYIFLGVPVYRVAPLEPKHLARLGLPVDQELARNPSFKNLYEFKTARYKDRYIVYYKLKGP